MMPPKSQSIIVLLCLALVLGSLTRPTAGSQLRTAPRRHLDGTNVLSLDETRTFMTDINATLNPAPHFYMSTTDLALTSQNPIYSDATEEDFIALLQVANQEADHGKRGGNRSSMAAGSNIRGGNGAGKEGRSCNDNNGRQAVFLDFDVDETFLAVLSDIDNNILEVLTFESYQLSEEEKRAILQRLEADYDGFKIDFVIEEPVGCEFSTLSFNTPPDLNIFVGIPGAAIGFVELPDGSFSLGGTLGRADGIDLLNKNMTDGAWTQVNFWTAIVQFFGGNGAFALEIFSGITTDNETTLAEALSIATVNQVAGTAAHELGHILGLRHYDSIGAPGDDTPDFISEIIDGGVVDIGIADQSGSETFFHIMASGASVGLPLQASATTDRFFSERSAIKILLGTNGEGLTYGEDDAKHRGGDIGSHKPGMRLKQLTVPNTIVQGVFAGKNLATSTLAIEANIDSVGEEGTDYFRFSFEEGQFITANAISLGDTNVANVVMTGLTLFQEDRLTKDLTPLVTHFQDFEGATDPLIFDFEIPESGNYVMSVFARDFSVDPGDYTLLVYSVDRALGPA